jgi:predicted RNA-binding protein Jag
MIRSIPEGVSTINAEGPHIAGAVTVAATELGVTPAAIQFTLDKAWFKNAGGGSLPRDTVKIIAWVRNAEEFEAADDARKWLQGLVERMGFDGTVNAQMRDGGSVVLGVDLKDRTRHFVGRRGVTLRAIRHLLEQSVGADYPDKNFSIDVADNRPRRDDDGDHRDRDDRGRGGGRDRDDRGHGRGRDRDDRGGRGRGRDRDDRGHGRDRDDRGHGRDRDDRGRGRDRDDRGHGRDRDDRGRDDDEANAARLAKMARNIAKRVARTGEAEIVRKELNSYDRRIVHMAIADFQGAGSRSLGDGSHKQIEIYAENSNDSDAGGGEE